MTVTVSVLISNFEKQICKENLRNLKWTVCPCFYMQYSTVQEESQLVAAENKMADLCHLQIWYSHRNINSE